MKSAIPRLYQIRIASTTVMNEVEANDTEWRGINQAIQLKTDYGWNYGGNGTNSSSFSGLPGGLLSDNGADFTSVGASADWWSSSSNGVAAWSRSLHASFDGVYRGAPIHQTGLSIRCIQDIDQSD